MSESSASHRHGRGPADRAGLEAGDRARARRGLGLRDVDEDQVYGLFSSMALPSAREQGRPPINEPNGTTRNSNMRTELIIFIRPPLIRSAAAAPEELRFKAIAHSARNATINLQTQMAQRRIGKSATAVHLSFRPRHPIIESWLAANRFRVE
jgi:hypothetical protein